MQEGPWLAPLFTAGALFYLATLLWWQGRASPKRSIVRPMVVFYILVRPPVPLPVPLPCCEPARRRLAACAQLAAACAGTQPAR